jgi:hypothetical protein
MNTVVRHYRSLTRRHARTLIAFASVSLICCDGTTAKSKLLASASAPGGALAASSAQSAAMVVGARDPKIVELAKAALACKFEEGSFDGECVAFTAWADNGELLENGKGNDTLLSMLSDPDERIRVLASRQGIICWDDYFTDEGHAKALFAAAAKETNGVVAGSLAALIADVDVEKLGLGVELRALAKHPVMEFRLHLARTILYQETSAAIETLGILLRDSDEEVYGMALSSLSDATSGSERPSTERLCEFMNRELDQTGTMLSDALVAASSSTCDDMTDRVIAAITKLVEDPSKVGKQSSNLARAVSGLCFTNKADGLNPQGFAIAQKLVDARVADPFTRAVAIDALADCDPAKARAAILVLTHDKDRFVADRAKRKLQELAKKPKR